MTGAKRVIWMVVAAACIGSFAMAEKEAKKNTKGTRDRDGKARFAAADTDGNGTLSLAEFSAAHAKRIAAHKARLGDKWNAERAAKMPSADQIFKKIDKDGDGALQPKEMKKAHRAHGKRGGRKGKAKAECAHAKCTKAGPAAE